MAAWYDSASIVYEIEFSAGVWTDVTAYVMDCQISRGRAYERDTFTPGVCSLVLLNSDRRFDPDYSSSPYSPNVLPMKQVRVTWTYAATPYRWFTGFIQGWPQAWDDPADTMSTVTVQALDALAVLALMNMPESRFAAEVKALPPAAWYRLGEDSSATILADSSGNGLSGRYSTVVVSTLVSSLTTLSTNGAHNSADSSSLPMATLGSFLSGTGWAVSLWLKVTGAGYSGTAFVQTGSTFILGVGNPGIVISFSSGGTNITATVHDGTTQTVITATVDLTSRCNVTLNRSGINVSLIVNGTVAGTTAVINGAATDFGTNAIIGGNTLGGTTLSMDEVILMSSAMSGPQPGLIWAAGSTAGSGQTVDARITQVLTDSGYTGATSLEASAQTCQSANYGGGSSLLAMLQALERTEQGRLFIAADGTLKLHARYHDLLNSTVAFALSDAPASSYRFAEMVTEYGVARLYNDVTATRTNGVAQRVTDATSVTAYRQRSLTIDSLQGQSDLEVLDLAGYAVQRAKNPTTRVPRILVKPRVAPATWFPAIGSLEIGSKITVARTPQAVGTAISKTLIVEAIRIRITPQGDLDYELQTSPVDDVNGNFLVLDDATRGQLDSNRLGF
jgi:hypothetical protein